MLARQALVVGIIALFWEDIKAWNRARLIRQEQEREARKRERQGYRRLSRFQKARKTAGIATKWKVAAVEGKGRSPRTLAAAIVDSEDEEAAPPPMRTEADLRRELMRETGRVEELTIKLKVHQAGGASDSATLEKRLAVDVGTDASSAVSTIRFDPGKPGLCAAVCGGRVSLLQHDVGFLARAPCCEPLAASVCSVEWCGSGLLACGAEDGSVSMWRVFASDVDPRTPAVGLRVECALVGTLPPPEAARCEKSTPCCDAACTTSRNRLASPRAQRCHSIAPRRLVGAAPLVPG